MCSAYSSATAPVTLPRSVISGCAISIYVFNWANRRRMRVSVPSVTLRLRWGVRSYAYHASLNFSKAW